MSAPPPAAGGLLLLPDAIRPQWGAPGGVTALMSTRLGGVSQAPFDSLNLRPAALGGADADAPAAVAENQRRFATALGAQPVWLAQVHGSAVQRLDGGLLQAQQQGAALPVADASISTTPGVACAVLVADCLPVLLCCADGRAVGAAHAGWRGLAGGVLEATVQALCEAGGCAPGALRAWLGPCIGPEAFEVGADVLAAFGAEPRHADVDDLPGLAGPGPSVGGSSRLPLFRFSPRSDGSARWRADLAQLARRRLLTAGVGAVAGGGWCTVSDPARFFSFRRTPQCGRLAAAVAVRPG